MAEPVTKAKRSTTIRPSGSAGAPESVGLGGAPESVGLGALPALSRPLRQPRVGVTFDLAN